MTEKDRNGKTTYVTIPKRIEVKASRQEGIQLYDLDNKYPQRMKLLASGSVTATTCLNAFHKYVRGKGFIDEDFGKSVINQKGQTANKMLGKASRNYVDFGGVAFHFDYNGLLEIINPKIIPFEYCRLGSADSENVGKICIYNDWEESTGRIKKDRIKYVDRFTDNKDILLQQIEEAGGLEKFNGHVLWFSTSEDKYPMPIYDSAIRDTETDAEISAFKNSNAKTQFLAAGMLALSQEFEEGSGEREAMVQQIAEFQGGQEAGKIMLIDGVTEENKPEFTPFTTQNNDRLFEYHETSVQENIRRAFLLPPELIGIVTATGFDTEKLSQARSYYNSVTEDDRDTMTELFNLWVPLMGAQFVGQNLEIKELFSDGNNTTDT